MGQHLGGDAFGQRLDQVVALIGQRRIHRLRQYVIGQHGVDMIAAARDGLSQIHGQVEPQALIQAAFRLKGADLGRKDVVAQKDAVGMFHIRHSQQIRGAGNPRRRPQFEATR